MEIPLEDDPPKLRDHKMEAILTRPMLSRYMHLVRMKYKNYEAPKLNWIDHRRPRTT